MILISYRGASTISDLFFCDPKPEPKLAVVGFCKAFVDLKRVSQHLAKARYPRKPNWVYRVWIFWAQDIPGSTLLLLTISPLGVPIVSHSLRNGSDIVRLPVRW